jgi:serine/threonine protein kinase
MALAQTPSSVRCSTPRRSTRSELFSLAVLTYQMLSGELPYGLQVPRVRSRTDLKRLRYMPLRHLRPELPGWVDSVLQKALHPDPTKRQEALSEFIQDLRSPGPQFRRVRAAPLVERHPEAFWKVIALVLGLAVLVLLALRTQGQT